MNTLILSIFHLQGPYDADQLVPVSSNAIVYYIKSSDFSDKDWLERTQHGMKTKKAYQVLAISDKPYNDCEIVYDRQKPK